MIDRVAHTTLIFLHGPPACGKSTIARVLLSLVPGRIFEQRAALQFAQVLFEKESEGYWDLVSRVRLLAIERAAQHRVPLVAITGCYSDPEDIGYIENLEAVLAKHGGRLLPVYITCDDEVLRSRVTAPERVATGKLCTEAALDDALRNWHIAPIPRSNCFSLDSGMRSPHECAQSIVEHFTLGQV